MATGSFIRVSTLFVKYWKERYARLVSDSNGSRGRSLYIYADRASMMAGDDPIEVVELSDRMALSSMKVHTGGPAPRIFYRHVAELGPDVALTGQVRLYTGDGGCVRSTPAEPTSHAGLSDCRGRP